MLDSLFLALFGLAVFLCALAAFDKDEIAWPLLSFITWVMLAITVTPIESQSSYLLADNTVVDHVVEYYPGAFMILFFTAFALVFVAIFFNRVLEAYKEFATRRRG